MQLRFPALFLQVSDPVRLNAARAMKSNIDRSASNAVVFLVPPGVELVCSCLHA
jgi:hypothetical protein